MKNKEALELYKVDDSIDKIYEGHFKRKKTFLLLLSLLLVFIFLVTPMIGYTNISITDVLHAIFTLDFSTPDGKIVWNARLVRIIGTILAGFGLALSGVVMQSILRNPLASPYTLGLSNAAAFGAQFAIVFVGTGSMAYSGIYIGNVQPTVLFAFLFSVVAVCIILFLTKITRVSPETMILAGIAMSAIFSALLSFTQYIANDSQLGNIIAWMFGDVGRQTWEWNIALLQLFCPIFCYFMSKQWDYNAMNISDDTASSLGQNPKSERLFALILTSLLCSLIVQFFGIIAFIGLLAPHIARMLIGNDYRYLIPASTIVGAIILEVSDQIAMNLFSAEVLPVGIITSLLGGPLFIILLIRRYRNI